MATVLFVIKFAYKITITMETFIEPHSKYEISNLNDYAGEQVTSKDS